MPAATTGRWSSSCSTISSGSFCSSSSLVFSLTIPHYFQIGIFANIVEQSTFVGVMAIGLSPSCIIAGNMDLSVESVMALAAMVTGILFASRGIGLGITLPPEWLVIPVSLAIASSSAASSAACNACLGGSAQDERLHRDARLLYLGARPGRGDLGRALGPGPAAGRCASSASRPDRRAADRPGSRSPASWFRLHPGEDAVRAPCQHDRRQPGRDLPGRHQGRPARRSSPSSCPAPSPGWPAGCWRSAPRAPRPISASACCSRPLPPW